MEFFIFERICREIINGEERDRAAVSLLVYGFITAAHREKNTERQYEFISSAGNEMWMNEDELHVVIDKRVLEEVKISLVGRNIVKLI